MKKKLIKEYINKKVLYESLTKTVASLVKVFLKDLNINYQKIEFRTKGVRSLENKVKKNFYKKKYENILDISDLSGVRIIVFFKDDIEKIIKILEKEFKIHSKENVDLNIDDNPKEFGYQSNHRVISINNERLNLKEYKMFKNIKCEIQVRTVLQHAWAEIEHDIGYKSEIEDSNKDRVDLIRLFAQNSALLEIADNNFLKIKNFYQPILSSYRLNIEKDNLNLPINIDSAREYFDKNFNNLNKTLNSQNIGSFGKIVGK